MMTGKGAVTPFRGHPAAAPLKAHLAIWMVQAVKHLPRPSGRGPIEGPYNSTIEVEYRTFRGHPAAAPLKDTWGSPGGRGAGAAFRGHPAAAPLKAK